jgi:FkbM family methyltransferase
MMWLKQINSRLLSGFANRTMKLADRLKRRSLLLNPNSLGEFYQNGGNSQLYEGLPLNGKSLVLDIGGYHGDWTKNIMARYACCSDIFEPVPAFAHECIRFFKHNNKVRVWEAGLGSSNKTCAYNLSEVATSSFGDVGSAKCFEARVIGVGGYMETLMAEAGISNPTGAIGCAKINVEGAEYEILETLLATNHIYKIHTLLVQFHRQPIGYQQRYNAIIEKLSQTHQRRWCYHMVWERWDLKTAS